MKTIIKQVLHILFVFGTILGSIILLYLAMMAFQDFTQ